MSNEPKQVFEDGKLRTISTWNPQTKQWDHPEVEKPKPVAKKKAKRKAKKKVKK